MSRVAVFDLDGTLLGGTSAERLLLPYLVRRGLVGWRQLAAALPTALAFPVTGPTSALRRNKRWLSGIAVEHLRGPLDDFVAEALPPYWTDAVRGRLERLRAQGAHIVLLTGAPDVVAEPIGRHLGCARIVATSMEVREGTLTGALAGPHLYAEQKRVVLLELAHAEGWDLSISFGFADRSADVPFLECFGHPVAVAPTRRLRRIAKRRGWEIVAPA